MMLSIIIIMFIILGTVIGIKRGFLYQLIKMLSNIIVFILALILKNPVADIILNHFDIIDVDKSVSIIFYRAIAFILLCFIFKLIIRLILKLTRMLEKTLEATIILAIPSKILGGILGFIEYYIYAFIILLILCIPIFKVDVYKSNIAKSILKGTPLVSRKIDISLLEELKHEYDKGDFSNEEEYVKILKRHGIIKDEVGSVLYEK